MALDLSVEEIIMLRSIVVFMLLSLAACSSKLECPEGKEPVWAPAPHLPGGARVECR